MQRVGVWVIMASVAWAANGDSWISRPEVQLISKHHLEYLGNLLTIYGDFSFLVHVDAESQHLGGLILARLSQAAHFIAIYNADGGSYGDLKRPPGIKFINLVLLRDPWTFELFLLKYRNVILYDNVVFVLYEGAARFLQSKRRFWEMRFIKLVGNVIVLDMDSPLEVAVYNKCYYCEDTRLKLLEVTESVVPRINANDLMPYKFNNFGGHFLIVSFLDYFPYMFCSRVELRTLRQQEFHVCTEFGGTEAKLVEVLSQELNFTYAFVVSRPRNTFAAIMRNLLNRSADFAVGGISVTYERFITATYTTNIRFQDINLLYKCRTPYWNHFSTFLLPFEFKVWLLIFATSAVTTFCMNKFININRQVSADFGYWRALKIGLKLTIDQPESFVTTKIEKTRWTTVLILGIFLFTCIEINMAYKGKLSSFFVRPPHDEPSDAEGLNDRGYSFIVDEERLDYLVQILTERDPVMLQLKQRGEVFQDKCEQLRQIFEHRSAILDEITELQYNFRYICRDTGGRRDVDRLRITLHPVRSIPHAWILQPAVPFWKSFDILIGKLRNAGFLDKWTEDALGKYRSYRIPYSKNNTPEDVVFDIATYSSIFLLYFLGNLVALIAFAAESLIARHSSKTH